MVPVHQRIIKIISKQPIDRSSVEMKLLLPWLRKRNQILAGLENDVLLDLLKNCGYEKLQRNKVIIMQGDRGDSFYIILTGKASVYIDTRRTEEQQHISKTEKSEDKILADREELGKQLGEGDLRREKIEEATDRSALGKLVANFDVGKAFGELALMSEDSTRNATIVADEDTDLLSINRELFNKTLKAKQEEDYEERRNFIEKCPLFRSWNPKFKKLLEMSLKKDYYPFGASMVRQGDAVQGLHFILSGQARVTVEPALHKKQYPKIFDPPSNIFAQEIGQKNTKKDSKSRDSLQKEHVRVRRKHGYAAAEKRLANKSVTVSCFESNEVVGDLEVILGLETYTNTVVCTANSQVFLVDVKSLERLVYKKNMSTMHALTRNVEEKLLARMNSPFVGSQVELYKLLHNKLLKENRQTEIMSETSKPDQAKLNADKEREQDMTQLMKLFMLDRSPLIPHAVPGSLYYMNRSIQKAEMSKRKADENSLSHNVRLERARKYSKRKPLSRRELEKICEGERIDYVKEYSQNKDHAIGRILNMKSRAQSGVSTKSSQRPQTAMGTTSVNSVRSTGEDSAWLKPVRVDLDHEMSSMLDFTEPPEDMDGETFAAEDVDQDVLKRVMSDMGGYQQMKQSSRSKIICSMLEKRASESPTRHLLRPKSAPNLEDPYTEDEDDINLVTSHFSGENHFDWDTSDPALTSLEGKIKSFLEKHQSRSQSEEDQKEKNAAPQRPPNTRIPELRRFVVEGPDDIPIPGGTVYVRQKTCKYPFGVSCPSHQHVRRYMIPKNAYTIATKSLAEINRTVPSPRSSPSTSRPKSIPPSKLTYKGTSSTSAWG